MDVVHIRRIASHISHIAYITTFTFCNSDVIELMPLFVFVLI